MQDSLQTLFYVFILAGILLICVEIFVPGAVLGALGGLSLVAALIMAFFIFKAQVAILIAIGMILLLGVAIVLWIKLFPKSGVGKAMTLANDGRDFKSADVGLSRFVGKEGEATSDLRPAGFAVIEGHRTDVLTEGEMIPRGARIRVTRVEGSRFFVRRI